jgi:hypothetical protein
MKSFAVSESPLWKVSPVRRVNVYSSPSSLTSQVSARSGMIPSSSSNCTSPEKRLDSSSPATMPKLTWAGSRVGICPRPNPQRSSPPCFTSCRNADAVVRDDLAVVDGPASCAAYAVAPLAAASCSNVRLLTRWPLRTLQSIVP